MARRSRLSWKLSGSSAALFLVAASLSGRLRLRPRLSPSRAVLLLYQWSNLHSPDGRLPGPRRTMFLVPTRRNQALSAMSLVLSERQGFSFQRRGELPEEGGPMLRDRRRSD